MSALTPRLDPLREPPPQLWGWPNVLWGVREGWWFAKRYLIYAIVLMLLGGPAFLRRNHVTALGLLMVYALGIPSIGAIAGALRPLCRTALGTAVVAAFAMIPITAAIVLLAVPSEYPVWIKVGVCVGFPLVCGPIGGLYLRSVYSR